MEVYSLFFDYLNLVNWRTLAQTNREMLKFCSLEKYWEIFYQRDYGPFLSFKSGISTVPSWEKEYREAHTSVAVLYESHRFLPIYNNQQYFRGVSAVSIGSINIILHRNGKVWMPSTFPQKSNLDDFVDQQICSSLKKKWKIQKLTHLQIMIGSSKLINNPATDQVNLIRPQDLFDPISNFQDSRIQSLPPIISIDQGKCPLISSNHYLLLDIQGKVWSFGSNRYGQCGFPAIKNIDLPTIIPNLPRIQAISAGRHTSLFLDDQGKVWVCGDNSISQLGLPIQNALLPTKLNYLPKISRIFAGTLTNFLLDTQGNLWVNPASFYSEDFEKTDQEKESEIFSGKSWDSFWKNSISQIIDCIIHRSDPKNVKFIQISGLPPIIEVVPLQTLTFILTKSREIWAIGYPGFLPGTGQPFDNLLLTLDSNLSARKLFCPFQIKMIAADTDYCFVIGENGELAQYNSGFTFSQITNAPQILSGSVSNFANLFVGRI